MRQPRETRAGLDENSVSRTIVSAAGERADELSALAGGAGRAKALEGAVAARIAEATEASDVTKPDEAGSWYALVDSATEGFAAYQCLRACGFNVRVAPAPRGVQACCGMSVLVCDAREVGAVRKAVRREGLAVTEFVLVAGTCDARRDRFC